MRQRTTLYRHGIQIFGGAANPIEAAAYSMVIVPRGWQADGTVPTVVCNTGYSAGGWGLAGFFAYFHLVERGFAIAATDCGDTPTTLGGSNGPGVWGYAGGTFNAKMDALVAWCEGKLGTKPNHILWTGGSHGGAGLNWVRAKNIATPGSVKAAAMVIPSLDVEDIRANNRNGFAASVEATHGGNAAWQARRATHNPIEYAAELPAAGVAGDVWYADSDDICNPARTEAFLAATGWAGHVYAGEHSTGGVDWVALTDFLEAHA